VALRSIGCRFSLDDFGSKESSYYYLKHLPIDFLKIDGSLVTGLSDEPSDAPFVSAIVETCRRLNIETVAEYVESATALEAINLAGVDHVQGYHVGVPEPLEVYLGPQFAESNRGWEAAIGDETTEESST
jgi:EAL domain-containing protein (putative c-di-GMP-specific phosphodiesterase class I)